MQYMDFIRETRFLHFENYCKGSISLIYSDKVWSIQFWIAIIFVTAVLLQSECSDGNTLR